MTAAQVANGCESGLKRDPTSDRPQLVDTLKEIFISGGVPIDADREPTPGVFSRDLSYLVQFRLGSRFGADSQADGRKGGLKADLAAEFGGGLPCIALSASKGHFKLTS